MSLDFLITSHIPLPGLVLDCGAWWDLVAHSFIHRLIFTGYSCVLGFILGMIVAAAKTGKGPAPLAPTRWS